MIEPQRPDPTVDEVPTDNPLDAALAAAFGPDPGPPLPAGGSVLQALSTSLPAPPRVLLRQPPQEPDTPVSRPGSPEMPPPGPLPGAAGRYQLLGEIARGGMGAVLKGRDPDLGRDIAVKVLLEAHAGKPELVQRFLEEAQVAGQLQHPGVTPVYELGAFPDRRPYFTMKLVKGQTLATLLAQRPDPAADLPRLVGIFEQVCQTLAYAHARGVIHRDLKPSNVMVGTFGEVQVMDWGLAKVLPQGGVADEQPARPPQTATAIRTGRGDGPGSGPHTQAGSVLGTPAYMAPEQARGDVELVDERADVFGLGAILCEVLTGQSPFTGRPAEAMRKAQTAQLADARARLDGCGAEGELVALARHCLASEQWERPRDAGQVAAAVASYRQSVAERLRRAELARAAEEARAEEARATAAQERRARRLTVALAASVLGTVLLGGGAWLWLRAEREAVRARVNRDVNDALTQATALRERARAAQGPPAAALAGQARDQAQRARALAESGPADAGLAERVRQLLGELDEEDQDRQLLAALDTARLAQAESDDQRNRFALERAVPRFREAFQAYGLPAGEGDAAAVAERIRGRPAAVREALLAALDEWVVLAEEPKYQLREPHLEWLRAVLAAAEPDGWGKQVRDAAATADPAKRRAALEKLAARADVALLPALALTRLAARLHKARAGPSAVGLLRRAQARYPGDFFVNQDLGMALMGEQSAQLPDAVRYLTAAVALRPDSAVAHYNLGFALQEQGKPDEAAAEYREAIRLKPDYPEAHTNLGNVLRDQAKLHEAVAEYREAFRINKDFPEAYKAHNSLGNALHDQGKPDEAAAEYREAFRLKPDFPEAHANLGNVLREQGRLDEAIAEHREASRLKQDFPEEHYNLGIALQEQGKLTEAVAELHRAIELEPKYALAHTELGSVLREQGRLNEAVAELRRAIELDPKLAPPHVSLGAALREQGKLDEAVAECRRAIELAPNEAMAHNNLGAALREQGKLDEAVAEYRRAIRLAPKLAMAHFNLANALQNQGNLDEAVTECRRAIHLDAKLAPAHGVLGMLLLQQKRTAEAAASLRRCLELLPPGDPQRLLASSLLAQAERLPALEQKLPAVLAGQHKPAPVERLEYAGLCNLKRLYAGAAQLYAGAFAADPKLAGDLRSGHRYDAACSAGLAGSGQGEDAKQLDDKARARWRQQALDWLRADLAARAKQLGSGKPADRADVQAQLRHWQRDADLAGLREPAAVARLPADEQEACRKLWADVAALLKQEQDEPAKK
jgi:serine/threonine-protein kinase